MTRCVCGNDIQPGDRSITVSIAINWGDDDQRANHAKDATFCSFACLARWALEKAEQHDDRVVPLDPEPLHAA